MNTHDERLHRHLQSLPDVPAPPGLGERIDRKHRSRVRRMRTGVAGVAIAVACLAAAPLLLRETAPPAQDAAAHVPPPDEETLARVRVLDRALQTAYDTGASDDEIASLWIARRHLLGGPAASARI